MAVLFGQKSWNVLLCAKPLFKLAFSARVRSTYVKSRLTHHCQQLSIFQIYPSSLTNKIITLLKFWSSYQTLCLLLSNDTTLSKLNKLECFTVANTNVCVYSTLFSRHTALFAKISHSIALVTITYYTTVGFMSTFTL
jgi:hypothetical protein